MLQAGTKAPDFSLPDQNGKTVSLSDFKGQKLILYLYSKDMTSGCSKQACAFAELYPQFMELNAAIVGVSKDTVASHKRFEEKCSLAFTHLSDTKKRYSGYMTSGRKRKAPVRSLLALCVPPIL